MILGLLIVLGVLLRLVKMPLPLTGDEACTFLWYASKPLPLIMKGYTTPNNHLFHSVLMHMCYVWLGPAEFVLRLPVFLASIGSVVLVWLLSLRLFKDKRTAALAVLFTAFSSNACYYASSGRGYALGAFFALALCNLALSQWARRQQTFAVMSLALLSFFCLYTMPSTCIFIVPFYTWLFFHCPFSSKWRVIEAGMWAVSLTIMAYGPNLDYMQHFTDAVGNTVAVDTNTPKFFLNVWEALCQGLLPQTVMAVLLYWGLLKCPAKHLSLFLSLLAAMIVATLVNPWMPQLTFIPRNWSILHAFVYILCANGLVHLCRHRTIRWASYGLLAVFLSLGSTEYVMDGLHPFDIAQQHRVDCMSLAQEAARKATPGTWLRGSEICDGTAMCALQQYGHPNKQDIRELYFFSESYKEAVAFAQGHKLKAIKAHGSVVMYRVY